MPTDASTTGGFLESLSPGTYFVDETIVLGIGEPIQSEDIVIRSPLAVVDPFEPEGRTIITRSPRVGTPPYFVSNQSDIEYTCGRCGVVLLRGVHGEDFTHITFQCRGCDSYNEFERAD